MTLHADVLLQPATWILTAKVLGVLGLLLGLLLAFGAWVRTWKVGGV